MAAGVPNVNALFLPYITRGGDHWDLLAWHFYGDPTLYGPIIMANPSIPIEPLFEPGLTIGIPLLSSPTNALVPQADLPPWQVNS